MSEADVTVVVDPESIRTAQRALSDLRGIIEQMSTGGHRSTGGGPGVIARPGDLWSFTDKDGDRINVERRDDVVSVDIESGNSGDDLMVWVPLDKALELAGAIQAAAEQP